MSEAADHENLAPVPAGRWPSNRPAAPVGQSEQAAERDAMAGFEVSDDFVRFEQRNDIFCRARWDERVSSAATKQFFMSHHKMTPRRGDGFRQRDFALRNAAWSVANAFSGRGLKDGLAEGFLDELQHTTDVAGDKAEIGSVEEQTAEIKQIARLFGADRVGIAAYDERWVYAEKYDMRSRMGRPNTATDGMTSVIVLAHAMDIDLIATMPSALASAAVGIGYSSEIPTALQVAEYIRNLGYQAVATANDTALAIPYAIMAGLGEYGRNQMVITPEFGPRVRFSKVFTDLPLNHDEPKYFGVRAYCDICDACASACPPKALPFGPPESGGHNQSNIAGVRKWSANCEKCFGYWAKLNTDCAICMRVCPYNRDFRKWHNRVWRWLAGGRWRHVALWLARKFESGARARPKSWWAAIARR